MARLDHRAAEDHRSTDQSHGTWRERIGRFPSGDSVDAGLRVFRQADHDRLGRDRIARAWAVLMKRLGYTRYVAQGGDWGAVIVDLMGVQAPPELLESTPTWLRGSTRIDRRPLRGAPPPPDLSAEERHAYDRLVFFYAKGLATLLEMGNRPQTLYGNRKIHLSAWPVGYSTMMH